MAQRHSFPDKHQFGGIEVGEFRQRARAEAARVVHQQVEAAQFPHRRCDLGPVVRVCDVAGQRDDARYLVQSVGAAGGADHPPSPVHQFAGDCATETGGGAGHECCVLFCPVLVRHELSPRISCACRGPWWNLK